MKIMITLFLTTVITLATIKRDPENKVFYGASESRKDGQAAGF